MPHHLQCFGQMRRGAPQEQNGIIGRRNWQRGNLRRLHAGIMSFRSMIEPTVGVVDFEAPRRVGLDHAVQFLTEGARCSFRRLGKLALTCITFEFLRDVLGSHALT